MWLEHEITDVSFIYLLIKILKKIVELYMLQVEYDLRLNQYLAETKCAANIYPRL